MLGVAGFEEPVSRRVPAGPILVRTVDDIVAWVYSLSGSAPHLFADLGAEFETELRQLLHAVSQAGQFADRLPDTEAVVWRKPQR